MKKTIKSVFGVTLLEIMLVLAIAAMIIVMSVRYYQSATANQQANAAMQMIMGITAAADGLAQGTNSYLGGGVSTSSIQKLMPNTSMTTPWGSQVIITDVDSYYYGVSFSDTPVAVCVLLRSRLGSDTSSTKSRYVMDMVTQCNALGPFVYYYTTRPF